MTTETKYTPTPEQQRCIDLYRDGARFKIDAYAGCGKTSTLKAMARANPRPALYLCFNKAIQVEAQKEFPKHVECRTTNSLALEYVRPRFAFLSRDEQKEQLIGNISAGYLAWKMKLPKKGMRAIAPGVEISNRAWAYVIATAINRYCGSGARDIARWCVLREGALTKLSDKEFDDFADQAVATAKRVWDRMCDPRDELKLGFNGCMKIWSLEAAQLDAEVVFVDEAQDTAGNVLSLLQAQRSAQCIAVGDQYQAIYAWRGAVDAMDRLGAEQSAALTQTFRFGEGLAGYATDILSVMGAEKPLRGNPAKQSTLGPIAQPDTILCRTNANIISIAMDYLGEDKRPHIVGGTQEIERAVEAAESLMNNIPVEHPDFLGFANWREVQEVAEKPEGAELKKFVRLVEDYGTDYLMKACASMPRQEKDADVVLSTGHKAKGREWDRVRLHEDFLRGVRTPEDNANKAELETAKPPTPEEHAEELKLFYVAATRAMEQLEIAPRLQKKLDVLREAPAAETKAA